MRIGSIINKESFLKYRCVSDGPKSFFNSLGSKLIFFKMKQCRGAMRLDEARREVNDLLAAVIMTEKIG